MKPTFQRSRGSRRGFALIVTVSILVLLALIAVGLLTLSTVTVRSSSLGSARAEAEANARLALQLALGDLQRTLGPDQAVTARATLVHDQPGEPNLLGAWKSWRWDPEQAPRPDYTEKQDRFQAWLVSTANPEDGRDLNLPKSALKDPVTLMRTPEGAASPTDPSLHGTLVSVSRGAGASGGYAFATMDESMKVPVHLPHTAPTDLGHAISRRTAPQRANPESLVPKLDPDTTEDPTKLISLGTASVAVGPTRPDEILIRQHELTTRSLSLLTDVARGGLRTDLTTLFESNVKLDEAFGETTPYFGEADGALRWVYLRDHYQHYRDVRQTADGTPVIQLDSSELRPSRTGADPAPDSERLLPVIAKMQVVFSIVTHFNHLAERVEFFNTRGNPRGNINYACPHLVYDPVVTLYNPYDVGIELPRLRMRIWDPPVVFGFKKNDDWLRNEFASEQFHGLARFQIANERNDNARKYFTLLLRDEASNGRPGAPIRLAPGEVKVFSAWVEPNWNWAYETRGGYDVHAFFDWNAGNDFGNRDNRTNNPLGVETMPGWDIRAGLQTDHLSYTTRPVATRYDFERQYNWDGGWLAIKRDDTFSVHAKAGRTVRERRAPDFEIDLLAGKVQDTERDILRSYTFRMPDVEKALTGQSGAPVIERTFLVDDLLQEPNDRSPGGKTPFGILTMSAKTTADPDDVSMPWLHNHPVTEGVAQDSSLVGNALDTYDLRFEEIQDFNTFPGVEIDPGTNRGFFGASATANRGVSNVPMFRVPLVPAASLGDLIPANLAAGSALPRVTHPLGSSRAHPLVPADAVTRPSPVPDSGQMLDHAYLLNDALWDRCFFSTLGSFSGELTAGSDRPKMLAAFLEGTADLLNPRLVPLPATHGSTADQAKQLDALNPNEFATRIAGSMAVAGGFNVNCDSVDAWRALLASLRDEAVRGWKLTTHDSTGKTAFPRTGLPLAGDAEKNDSISTDVQGQVRWAGFRALTDNEITELAEAIVDQIRRRGEADKAPSLSLAEFINRRVGSPSELHTLAGLLETAIEESAVNDAFHQLDSKTITGTEALGATALAGLAEPEARIGQTGEGSPSILTQGDLLMPLAPVITVRGDTFRIRAYGEARDGAGKTTARAWCEAVVQRLPEFIDPADPPGTPLAGLESERNKTFGRRFVITSFRWLSPDAI